MAVFAPRHSVLYPHVWLRIDEVNDTLIWPPLYPGLLELGVPSNRGDWTAEHWRRYAELLERMGDALLSAALAQESRLWLELHHARSKLRRRKSSSGVGPEVGGLFNLLTRQKPVRGRKRGGKNQRTAIECLAIRAELESSGKKHVTDMMALEELLGRQGLRRFRAREQSKGVLPEMSRQRKLQKLGQVR